MEYTLQFEKEYQKEIGTPIEDNLTGIFNHGFFQLSLDRLMESAKRGAAPFTLAMLDVDNFSSFNERHGALQGDLVLREVAAAIKAQLRQTDVAARFTGDGFAVMLPDTDLINACTIMDQIQHRVASLQNNDVTVSIGLAAYPQDGENKKDLLQRTVSALEQARTRGSNSLFYFDHAPRQAANGDHPLVLLVDDEPLNLKLLEALMVPLKYDIIKAANGMEALDVIAENNIDMVLLDVMMPEMDGFEVCQRIKANEGTRMIPVVLVTALDDVDSKVKGIEAGADDFITKPPHRAELIARTNSLIKLKKLNNNLANIETVLFSLAYAVEAKDAYTQGHIARVSNLGVVLGRKMGLSDGEMDALRFGGALHDIGKIGISEAILNKPGPLDPDEWAIMQTHADIGYRICLPLKKNLGAALDVVRHHHEKMDGSGYPDGLKGDEIAMVARIMAVVDIYDALITDRPYRKGLSREKAMAILTEDARTGKLDQAVVTGLIELVMA